MNYLKNIFIAGLLSVFMTSCIDENARAQETTDIKKNYSGKVFVKSAFVYDELKVEKIEYGKDKRTGLCFAFIWAGHTHGGPGFANVPCTDNVEKLISD